MTQRKFHGRTALRLPLMIRTEELLFISVAARMLGMHPQTLRKYERLGLIQPSRTVGSMRLYSPDELARLKAVTLLSACVSSPRISASFWVMMSRVRVT